MKNKDGGEGGGGGLQERGTSKLSSSEKGELIREGGLNTGFTVCVLCVKFYGRIFPKMR